MTMQKCNFWKDKLIFLFCLFYQFFKKQSCPSLPPRSRWHRRHRVHAVHRTHTFPKSKNLFQEAHVKIF